MVVDIMELNFSRLGLDGPAFFDLGQQPLAVVPARNRHPLRRDARTYETITLLAHKFWLLEYARTDTM